MKRPPAILWDWDNTLVDGWAAIEAGLNATFRAFAMPEWDRTTVLARVRGSLRDTFPGMFGAEWERARDIFYAAVQDNHLEVVNPMPGTAEMLAAASCIAPMGVVSNKQGSLLRAEAAHLGWAHHFDALVGAGDAAADKPDPAPMTMALAAMGVKAAPAIWYVGDTAMDMQAARRAGFIAVLLGDAAHDGGIVTAAPDLHFADAFMLQCTLVALAKG